ncbi:MAG: hypothetical protein M3N13_10910, partial [Candidatus Eremiobacteraeota bacterium]|nr:hypothetical protein [Candidatus Eremiobacteraeota bacterium]
VRPRAVDRPEFVRPRAVERPVYVRPRAVERPVYVRPRAIEHPVYVHPRDIERPIFPRHDAIDRRALPHTRAENSSRGERRDSRVRFSPRSPFIQYYPRSIVQPQVRYVNRAFVRPVQVVRSYAVRPVFVNQAMQTPLSYVYTGYATLYSTPVYARYITQYIPVMGNPYASYAPFYGYGTYNNDSGSSGYYGNSGYGNYSGYNGYNSYNNYPPDYSTNYPPYQQQNYNYPGQNSYPYQYGNGGQYLGYGQSMNPFGNSVLQGVVVANAGSSLVVLTPNLTPVFVNVTAAQQMGYTGGSLAPGSFVQAYGYSSGNQFIATAIN